MTGFTRRHTRSRPITAALVVGLVVGAGTVGSVAAAAATPSPAWLVQSVAAPTSFSAADNTNVQCETNPEPPQYGHCDRYTVVLTNVGTIATSGEVTVTDTLPAGVTTTYPAESLPSGEWSCETTSAARVIVTCHDQQPIPALTPAPAIVIPVHVPSTEGVATNQVVASGGGAAAAQTTGQTEITSPLLTAPAQPFAPLNFNLAERGETGGVDTQAGGHPAALTVSFAFPTVDSFQDFRKNKGNVFPQAPYPVPSEDAREIVTDLPPGLIGDARATATCSLAGAASISVGGCPAASRIGSLVLFSGSEGASDLEVFNITPEYGHAAEFAVYLPRLQRAAFLYATLVGSGADAHVRVTGKQPDSIQIEGVSLTFFGDPGVITGSPLTPVAFATNPANCKASGFTTTMYADSWEHPGRLLPNGEPDLTDPSWKDASSTAPPVSGCGALQFRPTLSLGLTATTSSAPTGVNANLEVPQDENPNGLATPPLKAASVTLPQGFAASPSFANGLEACSDAQIDMASNQPGSCPPGSQIATATVHTPLLAEPVEGQVFLGTPECDPCDAADAQSGRLVRAFLQVHSERYGVTLKVPGIATLNAVTGQVTVSFDENPQQPFSDLELHFKGGPRAPLSTPAACGTYQWNGSLTPWSTPYTPTVEPSGTFTITGCDGSPFAPAFLAGTTSNQAAQFSPLTISLSRTDQEQRFSQLEAVLPPGLSAKLAGIPECGEAEIAAARANSGECPASSQLGTVTVGAGPGSDPYYVTGRIYLTGAYNGGPFGEVVVVPAVAGPFNLGNVVVRGSIRVNPVTAQGSVLSDPFPSILDGIPLQERSVLVNLNRPEFTFNASSCEPMALTGTLTSTRGARAALSSRYQAAGCASLPFKPVVTAATNGLTSKQRGASLQVKITSAGIGQANIAKVDLTIPKVLPSRLTTLQKACLAKVFEANPAACPSESDIGTAVVHTPLLNSPLTGPVYFVSHGGAAFPDTEIVLQGEGVKLVLDGHTDIKGGVTYSRFETVPDAPFTSFEFKAPEGPYSIFGANGNLCHLTKTVTSTKKATRRIHGQNRKVTVKVKKQVAEALTIPTTLTAQNGAVLNQATKVAVTNCPKVAATQKASAKKASKTRKAGKTSAARPARTGRSSK